jgi:predicted Zn-dependent protease
MKKTLLACGLIMGLVIAGMIALSAAEPTPQLKALKKLKKAKDTLKKADTLRKSFADITEEEEYYIGRAVAALVLSRYPVYDKSPALTTYLNTLGTVIALHSDRPETYAGYHFLILDTDEVNALAAPGGLIFITKGLLKRCRDEEMLAAILAHEIGHVQARHGLKSIKKSRLIDAFKLMGEAAADKYAPAELSQLTGIFEEALGDIAESLIEKGYDRKYEYEADELGVENALRTGYNPLGLSDFLQTMVEEESEGGWFKTHPSAKDRLKRVEKKIKAGGELPDRLDLRAERFKSAVAGLK